MPLRLRSHDPASGASRAEIRAAWQHYLRVTRQAPPEDYLLVEERAWSRLVRNLAALGAPLGEPGRPREPE